MKFIFNIDKIEDDEATLNDGGGKIINWPIDKLPLGAKKNDKITFSVGEEDNLAKDILNEILDRG
ncbi:MAG: hypothetical protein PHE24_04370 [Patescibacteria group bacterium]|nr:hypothetical protein [Patescibacteria group bacterium]